MDATEGGRFPALRLNALPVSNFRRALHIRCRDQIDERPGVLLRELQLGIPGIGVATGRDFYGSGSRTSGSRRFRATALNAPRR